MNIRNGGWVLPLLLLAFTSLSTLAQTQAEMDREACNEYKHADAELNRVYQQVIHEYKADGLFIEKLRGAQRAWLAYRDAQIEALYPARDPLHAYGSVHRMCHCQAMTELTLERTEVLRRWVMGVEEGDVCSGSIRIRG
ncbi:MAG TPA: lysozyme inhibitor LprI family protein [Thermoanaerobaculia bacterium]|nr:lysozyme inhibitor LprI family protein [Thermoanaerobaculia bacterium]